MSAPHRRTPPAQANEHSSYSIHLIARGGLDLYEFDSAEAPEYVALSHTWDSPRDELTMRGLREAGRDRKENYHKLQFCRKQASEHGVGYFWMDTCCVDRDSENSTSQHDAVNYAARIFAQAKVCIVHLKDVHSRGQRATHSTTLGAMRKSRWFTRSWTLVELLKPKEVYFYTAEGELIGTRSGLAQLLSDVTGIDTAAFRDEIDVNTRVSRRRGVQSFTVQERFSWAEGRSATRPEDEVYSLLGLFEVTLPLMYGQTKEYLKARLMRALERERLDAIRSEHTAQLCFSSLPKGGFRVLSLESGEYGSPLTARLEVRLLDDPGPYYALSYTWGQEPNSREIDVDGRSRKVFENVFHALQRMRSRESSTYFWIDYLCIDQSNRAELQEQVQQMSRIFSSAKGVWAWLGEEDAYSKKAMELIPRVCCEDFVWVDGWWRGTDFTAFEQLLHRPIFTRAWIVQEFASSADTTIHCGGDKISFDQFDQAIELTRVRMEVTPEVFTAQAVYGPARRPLSGFRNGPAPRLLDAIKKVFSLSPGKPRGGQLQRTKTLEQLVSQFTFCQMTEHRDAVYSLIGLAKTSMTTLDLRFPVTLMPDYSAPIDEAFAKYIEFCCRTSRSSDILVRPWAPVADGMSPEDPSKLPSWIATRDLLPFGDPALNLSRRLHGDVLVGMTGKSPYSAHAHELPSVSLSYTYGKWDGVLKVRGMILGDVLECSPRMAEGIVSKVALDDLVQVIDKCGHKLPKDLWRCLCADQVTIDGEKVRAPSTYEHSFVDVWKASLGRAFGSTMTWTETPRCIDTPKLLTRAADEMTRQLLEAIRDTVISRCTFVGKRVDRKAMYGLVPRQAEPGDKISIIFGCSVPVVLREQKTIGDMKSWKIVGEAYVHRMMSGEALKDLRKGGVSMYKETELALR